MKPLLLVIPLLLSPLTFASDQAWPSKGEKVYVSASFKGLEGKSPVPGASMKYDMPACKELTVTKADAKKQRWTLEDLLGSKETLEGPWESRMHKSETECQSHYSTAGEPDVQRSGMVFRIRPKDDGKK